MALKFHKVTTLPGSLEADSFYFVVNGAHAESYITSSDGTAKSIGNTAMITAIANDLIADAIAQAAASPIDIVANIAARDALTASATMNRIILVTDATGDPTVTAGAALYVWNETASSITKIAEYENMDVTLTWASIQGRPTSSVSQIDDAVSKRHTHANLTTLDKLGDSGGALTYDGQAVSANWNTTNW